jgi:hypothetical protein
MKYGRFNVKKIKFPIVKYHDLIFPEDAKMKAEKIRLPRADSVSTMENMFEPCSKPKQ